MSCYKFSSISIPSYCFIAIFAISSWIDIVGLWVELPLIINHLPESWNLPSYMALTIQLSNIAPAIYTIVSKVRSLKRGSANMDSSHRKRDVVLSFLIISVEALSIFLLSFFWKKTAIINGTSRSVALLSFLACCALCSCLSSLVYLPFMARYPSQYLSAYYIGQGLSGLLPGLVGLAQGLGGDPTCVNTTIILNSSSVSVNCSDTEMKTVLKPLYPPPKFSVKIYFIIVCLLLLVSLLSFYILNFTSLKRHQSSNKKSSSVRINIAKAIERKESFENVLIPKSVSSGQTSAGVKNSRSKLIFHLVLVALLNAATNGIIPSTQSYTCLSYGNLVYTLTIRLCSVVGPIASLSTMFLPKPGEKILASLTSSGLIIVVFHIVLALQSPHPILQHQTSGPVLVIFSALIMTACFSFVRVSVASVLHELGGRKALIWCGGVTQIGSFCGAFLAFLLINFTSLFTSSKPCTQQ